MVNVKSALRRREESGVWRPRRWSDLSGPQRATLITMSTAELVLTTIAAVDLYRRPKIAVRGPKQLWWPTIFVQPVGPVAYLAFGRRRG
jgi:phospholipase D-like protein